MMLKSVKKPEPVDCPWCTAAMIFMLLFSIAFTAWLFIYGGATF